MGFANLGTIADNADAGLGSVFSWRKTPSQTTLAGVWFDLSMSPGNPIPNYYASSPLVSATLNGAEGMPHGGDVSPLTKHLSRFTVLSTSAAPLPMPGRLLDYLLYYPFVDMGSTDTQALTNSTTLPRYTDGAGVQVMAVLTNPPSAPSGLTFTVSYTNSSGVSGRTATGAFGAGTVAGSIATSDRAVAGTTGPFIRLQTGDTGVRSIESFAMVSGTDVGLITLVLVKPLAQWSIRGIDAVVELEYLTMTGTMPRIVDGAYLGAICCPIGSLSSVAIHGLIQTTWGTD